MLQFASTPLIIQQKVDILEMGLRMEGSRDNKILESALARAKDCASDPICYHSEGQGVGGLNFAACYSCSLLPETSCEEFNSYLDRALLIDERYGFYKDLTPK